MLTSGGRTKFGLSPEAVENAIPSCAKMANISLRGFHFHVGSQLMDASAHLAAMDVLLALIRDLRFKMGFETRILDMGGGFGVPYTDADRPIPVGGFIEPMVERAEKFCAGNGIKRPDLIIEPGRYIVGPSGITLYTVCSVKEVPGVTVYAGIDGGYPDNPRPALYEAVYDAVVANRYGEPPESGVTVTIAGKCCETGDIVIRDIPLPAVGRDDVIAVFCTGAYNYSMANNYNKTPIPAIVAIKNGHPRLSVRRQTYADLYACDLPPDDPAKAPSAPAE
jgi:diaminopimelate decarboxylase